MPDTIPLRARVALRVHRRLVGLFVRHGVIPHPYGAEYARERYGMLGGRKATVRGDPESQEA